MFAALAVFLLLIPLTVFFGLQVLGDRKYMTVSLLALLEGILPFFLLLEARRPQARELVTLGVLCALGVAGRIAFAPLPQVKPIAAVVILSGVALGGEAGFLVGAVTALVSNFYFGQGPWTPYQMFALGLLGFFAGLLFCGRKPPPRALLCLYGFLSVLLVYGGIMTPADAKAMLDAGADLLQLYTGYIYEGPGLVGEICRSLIADAEAAAAAKAAAEARAEEEARAAAQAAEAKAAAATASGAQAPEAGKAAPGTETAATAQTQAAAPAESVPNPSPETQNSPAQPADNEPDTRKKQPAS